jgi:hypothetical protein
MVMNKALTSTVVITVVLSVAPWLTLMNVKMVTLTRLSVVLIAAGAPFLWTGYLSGGFNRITDRLF